MRSDALTHFMTTQELPNHNDESFREFSLVLRALCTIPDQVERGRRYQNALVKRRPQMAGAFEVLGYPL